MAPINILEKRKINEVFEDAIKQEIGKKAKYPDKVSIPFRNEMEKNAPRNIEEIPLKLIRFRKDNGRISTEVATWEKEHWIIKEKTLEGQERIREFLSKKDKKINLILKKSLEKFGQKDEAIITCDGFLINGNRRKMVLDELSLKHPQNDKFRTMRVVILPGENDPGGAPSLLEIEEIENRLQLHKEAKADYKGPDRALSIRRKRSLGMSLEHQLRDDPLHANANTNEMNKAKEVMAREYTRPLEIMDMYLNHFGQEGLYELVKDRWQAFIDYGIFYHMVKNESSREKYFNPYGKVAREYLEESEIPLVNEAAFNLIRKKRMEGLDTTQKLHTTMREIKNYLSYKGSKKAFLKIADIPAEVSTEKMSILLKNDASASEIDDEWQRENGPNFTRLMLKTFEEYRERITSDLPLKIIEKVLLDIDKLAKNIPFVSKKREANKLKKLMEKAVYELEEKIDLIDHRRQNL
jgi:hypothetical protein